MLRSAFIGSLLTGTVLSSCMTEPDRLVEYRVDCIHCKVQHLDQDGQSRTDTVREGFVLRFPRGVGEKVELVATSFVGDSSFRASVFIDYSEHARETGSGTPQVATISDEVPKRSN